MSLTLKTKDELVAETDLFLTQDYHLNGKVVIVTGDDYRAAVLLARKGDAIDMKTIKRLGLTTESKVEKTIKVAPKEAPKVLSAEQIEGRATRPEAPAATR